MDMGGLHEVAGTCDACPWPRREQYYDPGSSGVNSWGTGLPYQALPFGKIRRYAVALLDGEKREKTLSK
jgi:hypothetical protein